MVTVVTVRWARLDSNGCPKQNSVSEFIANFRVWNFILYKKLLHVSYISEKLLVLPYHLMACFPVDTMFWRSLSSQHIHSVIIFSLVFAKNQTNNCQSEYTELIYCQHRPTRPKKEEINLFHFFLRLCIMIVGRYTISSILK